MIYILWHAYDYVDSEGNEEMVQKCLGIYNTKELAEAAIERYYCLPGFREFPKDCFEIEKSVLDTDFAWTEGFVKW